MFKIFSGSNIKISNILKKAGMGKLRLKSAFTIAEIIIVMGIIGIIAQMTIPELVRNIQNAELQVQFKKTYSDLNQISTQFKSDYGMSVPEYTADAAAWHSFIDKDFWAYFRGGGKVLKHSFGESNSNLYRINTILGNYIGDATNGGSVCDVSSYYSEIGGRVYTFNDRPQYENNGPIICVDINGEKKPNRYGYDFFLFIFTKDGFVIPMGLNNPNNASTQTSTGPNFFLSGPDYCQKQASASTYQLACSYYALTNTHPTDAGKDYWNDFLGGK